jgi:hypothetical protein
MGLLAIAFGRETVELVNHSVHEAQKRRFCVFGTLDVAVGEE